MNRDAASTVSYATSLSVSLFGMSVNELVAVLGLGLAAGTFLVNWYYRHRMLQLAAKGKHHGSANGDY